MNEHDKLSTAELDHIFGGVGPDPFLAAVKKQYHAAGLPKNPAKVGFSTHVARFDPPLTTAAGTQVGEFTLQGRGGLTSIFGKIWNRGNGVSAEITGRTNR